MSVAPLLPQSTPIYWPGLIKRYQFQLDQLGAVYRAIPGVYIFCRLSGNGMWQAVYVGQTDSFHRRLTEQLQLHHRWSAIRLEKATHISTLHVTGGEALRLSIETDLRNGLNPPCNRQ